MPAQIPTKLSTVSVEILPAPLNFGPALACGALRMLESPCVKALHERDGQGADKAIIRPV